MPSKERELSSIDRGELSDLVNRVDDTIAARARLTLIRLYIDSHGCAQLVVDIERASNGLTAGQVRTALDKSHHVGKDYSLKHFVRYYITDTGMTEIVRRLMIERNRLQHVLEAHHAQTM